MFQAPCTALDLVTAALIPGTEIRSDNTKLFEFKHQSICRSKYTVSDSPSDLDSHSQEIQTLSLVSCCETVQIEEREPQQHCFKLGRWDVLQRGKAALPSLHSCKSMELVGRRRLNSCLAPCQIKWLCCEETARGREAGEGHLSRAENFQGGPCVRSG